MKIRWKAIKSDNTSCIVPTNSKYCLKYEPGTSVTMIEGTVGIAVFKTYWKAKKWAICDQKIIRVKCYGKKRMPFNLAFPRTVGRFSTAAFNKFYHESFAYKNVWSSDYLSVPNGTEFYRRVEVSK